MEIISELIHSALATSARAHLGVSLIYIYMALIVGTAVVRIVHNIKNDKHH